jgi:hypothetical protein
MKVKLFGSQCHIDNYAALSHRWVTGPVPNWVTKKSNIYERINGFLIRDLPKSIQDAITITRRLGLRYLWVDSLCILQDSLDDWEIESAQMMKVYTNAFVTLFADAAFDDEAGYLGRRSSSEPAPLLINLRISQDDKTTLPVYIRTPNYNDDSSFEEDVERSPLASRAWILQEQVMSRRIIHFGKSQMIWECRTCIELENGLACTEKEYHRKWLDETRGVTTGAAASSDSWRKLVEVYSRCQLTQSKDKLPAISGIASAYSAKSGDRYLAGLWEKTLHLDLAWSVSWSKVKKSLHSRAPSWSWCSITGEILYKQVTSTDMNSIAAFNILGVDIPVLGKNAFGQIGPGALKLSGHLLKATSFGPYIDKARNERSYPLYTTRLTPIGHVQYDHPNDIHRSEVTCLRLMEGSSKLEYFLVLALVPDHDDTTGNLRFRRIGLGDSWLSDTSGSGYFSESIFAGCGKQEFTLV